MAESLTPDSLSGILVLGNSQSCWRSVLMHDLGTLNFNGNCLLSCTDLCYDRAAFIDGFMFQKVSSSRNLIPFKKKKCTSLNIGNS